MRIKTTALLLSALLPLSALAMSEQAQQGRQQGMQGQKLSKGKWDKISNRLKRSATRKKSEKLTLEPRKCSSVKPLGLIV